MVYRVRKQLVEEAAETAWQHSGLSSQAIITLSVRSLCRRARPRTRCRSLVAGAPR